MRDLLIGVVIVIFDALFNGPILRGLKWLLRSIKIERPLPSGTARYFRRVGKGSIDILVYPLGLRADVPLVDLLYFEYARSLLLTGVVKRLLVFPSPDLTASAQDAAAFSLLEHRINEIFSGVPAIEIIDVSGIVPRFGNELLTREFLEQLQYVGSSEFLGFVRESLGINVRNFGEFNKTRPYSLRLVTLYVHIVRNWLICSHLRAEKVLSGGVKLGFLLWETEVDKLGVFHRLQKESGLQLFPFLGKTVFGRKRRPMPTFEPGSTLNLFDTDEVRRRKLEAMQPRELIRVAEVLEAILAERGRIVPAIPEAERIGRDIETLRKIGAATSPRRGISRHCLRVVGLFHEVKQAHAL